MKGTIKRIEPINQVSDSFKKQELILSVVDGEYEQTLCIEFHQDSCAKLDAVGVGQEVDVSISIRGREWTNPKDNTVRVFNTLVGWKIAVVGEAKAEGEKHIPSKGDDDLPF